MTPRSLRLLLLSASLLAAAKSFADDASPQTEPPASPPPSETAKSPASDGSVVVFSDAIDDETENAKLRARVYEVARQKGLVPDPKADVAATAQAKGALEEGRVSTSETSLEGVRGALGVGVLIRIAREGTGVRVVVVRDRSAKSKLAASKDEVTAVVAELLGAELPAAAAAGAAPSGAQEPSISAGLMLRAKKTDEEPELTDPKALSRAWEKRGGLRASFGVHAVVTGVMIPKTPFVGQNPETGAQETGTATTYGVGGGLGLDLSMLYLPVPEPVTGSTNFAAFRLGVRADVNGLYVRPPEKFSYRTTNGQVTSRDKKFDNVAYVYGVLPLQAGVHFAFGDFRLPTLWRGFVLGAAYSPAWIFSLKVGEKENATDSKFNYAGFELSLDTTKLEAGEGSQPQLRVTALVLPRVEDDLPWLASLGIGAIWY